jgi:hypothetical protein
MQFTAGLTGEAAALARTHGEALARLPATIRAFVFVELHKWPVLFAPEQRYQRTLLEHFSRLPKRELEQAAAAIGRIEAEAGVNRLGNRSPAQFQDEAQALLRKRGLNIVWRNAVDEFFQNVDAALEPQLYPPDAPRRLVIQLYDNRVAVQRDKLWSRFTGVGVRVPLNLDGATTTEAFLRALFGAREHGSGGPLFAAAVDSPPLDPWIIESHEALHALCDADAEATPAGSLIALSYDRLRPYRDELTRALNNKIQSGVESPQAFATFARSLRIAPPAGALLHSSDAVLDFVRDVLLTGNGTLLMNNTFVEWAAVQALRRAQPRILVTRFGVRNKLKPFSSMLMFSQPRGSDRNPIVEDPAGSFIDVEQLSYYVWLNAEKNPAYRKKTLYLFLAEGADQMLAIRSDMPPANASRLPPARLADVCATMAHWLALPLPDRSGQPILALVGQSVSRIEGWPMPCTPCRSQPAS